MTHVWFLGGNRHVLRSSWILHSAVYILPRPIPTLYKKHCPLLDPKAMNNSLTFDCLLPWLTHYLSESRDRWSFLIKLINNKYINATFLEKLYDECNSKNLHVYNIVYMYYNIAYNRKYFIILFQKNKDFK